MNKYVVCTLYIVHTTCECWHLKWVKANKLDESTTWYTRRGCVTSSVTRPFIYSRPKCLSDADVSFAGLHLAKCSCLCKFKEYKLLTKKCANVEQQLHTGTLFPNFSHFFFVSLNVSLSHKDFHMKTSHLPKKGKKHFGTNLNRSSRCREAIYRVSNGKRDTKW